MQDNCPLFTAHCFYGDLTDGEGSVMVAAGRGPRAEDRRPGPSPRPYSVFQPLEVRKAENLSCLAGLQPGRFHSIPSSGTCVTTEVSLMASANWLRFGQGGGSCDSPRPELRGSGDRGKIRIGWRVARIQAKACSHGFDGARPGHSIC